ncbi:hypothetical protein ASD64_01400 [Mesorhizobium sp. Root157]|uniref:GcrA family cell cycle regulator n=1 Tax=Mesorhizobium sp. Root157 TaxID=1736477 RepID=UPI0006F6718C|nr:GcrA family cell cycle regulator [Mesorhizobium sp. Root157]KRA00257.1 hypothetical protein ASD64_01400 [Mesorhizobium sp. Root157]
MDWQSLTTQERIEAIKAAWQPGMSAQQIASAVPCVVSRNAIIGMLDRHGDKMPGVRLRAVGDNGQVKGGEKKPRKSRAKPASELRRPRSAPRIAVVSPSILFDHAPSIPLPEPEYVHGERLTVGRPIRMLGHGECRWAVNDAEKGDMHLFCGAPADGPWCECHRLRSISRGTESERAASRVLLAA